MEVSDSNANVVVDVKFDSFKFGTEFEKDAFDMQRNMTAATEKGGQTGTDSGVAPAGKQVRTAPKNLPILRLRLNLTELSLMDRPV